MQANIRSNYLDSMVRESSFDSNRDKANVVVDADNAEAMDEGARHKVAASVGDRQEVV